MAFENKWISYQSYLCDMRSSFRRQISHNLSKADFKLIGYENKNLDTDHALIEIVKPSEVDPDIIYSQYLNVLSRSDSVLEILNKDFFVNFLNRSTCSKVIVLRKEKYILGNAIIVEEGRKLTFMLVGIQEEYRNKYATYFNLVNAVIIYGIENHFKEIGLGQTSYYLKSRIGGKIKPMVIFNYSPDKLINYLFKILNNILFPDLKLKTYHVFKVIR